MNTKLTVEKIEDIPATWKVLRVRKKTTVRIRHCGLHEKPFKVSWSDSELVADPLVDIIVISETSEYPCKANIFQESYVPFIENGHWDGQRWVKKASWRIVEIPEGFEVEVKSLEGDLKEVAYPDYIAIGIKGELYVNIRDFVTRELEIID